MAAVCDPAGAVTAAPEPAGGWDREAVAALVGPAFRVSELAVMVGGRVVVWQFAHGGPAEVLNLAATTEARTLIRGACLVIPPGETLRWTPPT